MDAYELVEEVDIVNLISQYVDLKENNGEFWGLSPFKEEKTPSFSVRRETGRFYCFASGIGGNAITFLKYYHNISSHKAVEMLKEYLGVSDKGASYHKKLMSCMVCKKYAKPKDNPKECSTAILPKDYMDRFEDRPEKYQVWRNEGITDEAMSYFGVKYDPFSNYIVYPIKKVNGDLCNVGGRTLDIKFKEKGLRKYTYFKPWGGRMDVVYGIYENYDSIMQKREVIVFEGMKSVLLARGYGYKNACAILTSHLNPEQMKIFAKLGVKVIFALDKDVNIRADKNIASLSRYVSVYYIHDTRNLIGEKDSPVDKGKDVFEALYNNRIRYKR